MSPSDDRPEAPVPQADAGQPGTSEPVQQEGRFQMPSDYYSTPPPVGPERKGCPKWIPIGCGALGCLLLLLILAAGAFFMARPGRAIDFLAGRIEKEAEALYESDVTAEEKQAFRSELARFRKQVRSGEMDMTRVQAVLEELNGAIRDRRLTSEEVRQLTEVLRQANGTAKSSSPGGTSV